MRTDWVKGCTGLGDAVGWRVGAGLVGVTLAGASILGYHPYAEDGGIYLAEIKRVLDTRMYPLGVEFVSGHLGGVPGFAKAVGWVVRDTGWRLDWVMLSLHMVLLWGISAGAWMLAARCYAGATARWGAVGLVAVCWSLPVAGTSLMLVDPYVTARSVSLAGTVLGLAGVAEFVLGRRLWGLSVAVVTLGLAVLAHPLMGGYGVGEAVILGCLLSGRRSVRFWGIAGAAGAALILAGGVQAVAPGETAAYGRVAATRYYWFLSEWKWYEWVGLVAPMGILSWAGWKGRGLERGLAWMGVLVGGIGLGVAVVFAREGARVHAVARMQPLRCFQVVYLVMLVVIGAWLGERVLKGIAWRRALAAVGLGGVMWLVQAETYAASRHLELPGMAVVNRWEQAFVWISENTPKDALFGLDADYVHRAGEDAHGFRALAERSALPDYSKDGGQAAIRPELTEAWVAGQATQAGLTEETDAERLAKLRPMGVTWVVMGREARTGFVCPYRNDVVMVCRLGR